MVQLALISAPGATFCTSVLKTGPSSGIPATETSSILIVTDIPLITFVCGQSRNNVIFNYNAGFVANTRTGAGSSSVKFWFDCSRCADVG